MPSQHSMGFEAWTDKIVWGSAQHGRAVPSSARLAHLKSKLAAVVSGKERWLENKCRVDEVVRKEVCKPQAISQQPVSPSLLHIPVRLIHAMRSIEKLT